MQGEACFGNQAQDFCSERCDPDHQPALAQLEEHVTVEVYLPVGSCWYHGVVGLNPTGRTFCLLANFFLFLCNPFLQKCVKLC